MLLCSKKTSQAGVAPHHWIRGAWSPGMISRKQISLASALGFCGCILRTLLAKSWGPKNEVAIPVADEENGSCKEGQVTVLSRNDPGEIQDSSQTILPCFVAVGEDLDTLELNGPHSASDLT